MRLPLRICSVLICSTTLVLRGWHGTTPVDVHRGLNPRRYGSFVVHTVDAHSNNSGAELAPPSAIQLARLAQQSRAIHPADSIVTRNQTPMRSLQRRLTPEVRQSIVSRYAAGESAKALSEEFDISRDGVRKLLKRAGVTIRPQNVVTSQAAKRIVHLYDSGLTIKEVVAQVGTSFGTVRRVLYKHGGVMRVSPIGKRTRRDE